MSRLEHVRVVVVDDHPVFRIGMAALLESLDSIEVVGQAADAAGAVEAARDLQPDVVLMDLDLGGDSGVEATRSVVRVAPEAGVLVVTMLGDDESLFASIRAGARGYLLKGASPDEIERAVRAVANGEVLLGPQVAVAGSALPQRRAHPRRSSFPRAHRPGARGPGPGRAGLRQRHHRPAARAEPKTVRNYVYGILSKLEVDHRAHLVVRAREAGLGTEVPEY